jgi:hypothetical protein
MTAPDDTQALTIRLPAAVYEKLRRDAFDQRTSMNALIIEARAAVPVPVLEALASAWEDQARHESAYDWPGRVHVDALNSCARMLREAITSGDAG